MDNSTKSDVNLWVKNVFLFETWFYLKFNCLPTLVVPLCNLGAVRSIIGRFKKTGPSTSVYFDLYYSSSQSESDFNFKKITLSGTRHQFPLVIIALHRSPVTGHITHSKTAHPSSQPKNCFLMMRDFYRWGKNNQM